jgi:hypothetical protein
MCGAVLTVCVVFSYNEQTLEAKEWGPPYQAQKGDMGFKCSTCILYHFFGAQIGVGSSNTLKERK